MWGWEELFTMDYRFQRMLPKYCPSQERSEKKSAVRKNRALIKINGK